MTAWESSFFSGVPGVLEQQFLHHNGNQGSPQRQSARGGQLFPMQPSGQFDRTGNDDAGGRRHQRQPDKEGGDGFVFPVAVVMGFVLRLGTDAHQKEHNHVGDEIRQRVHRIGHHGGTVSHHAGNELEGQQRRISRAAYQGYLVNLLFPKGRGFVLLHIRITWLFL